MAIDGPKKGQQGGVKSAPKVTAKPQSSASRGARAVKNSDALRLPAHAGLFPTLSDSKEPQLPKAAQLKHKLGQDDFPPEELNGLSPHLFAEHLMLILANRRKSKSRGLVMKEVAEMLILLGDPARARKVIALMPKVGKIVDIYPLELLDYLLRESPASITGHSWNRFIKNRAEIEANVHKLGDTIELRVPLALKMQSFALKGGGAPGYALAPGPPGVYWLEFGQAGEYSLLFQGQVRRQSFLDTLVVRVAL